MIIPELNFIMNGCMRIAQAGTTFTSTADSQGYRILDRWCYSQNSAVRTTITQDTDVPAISNLSNSLKLVVNTEDSSIAAGEYCNLYQQIEGYNFQQLSGKVCLLSFWIKSTATGTMCVSFRNADASRSYVSEVTINSTNTWELKTVQVTFNATGTWNYIDGIGLYVSINLSCGSTYQTTANAWQTGNYISTSNQTNFIGATNTINITGVQLHRGSRYIPFQMRKYQEELELCMRYFYQMCPHWHGGTNAATTVSRIGGSHPVPMLVSPTTVTVVGSINVTEGTGGATVAITESLGSLCNTLFAETSLTVATGLTVRRACFIYLGQSGSIAVSVGSGW